MSVISMVRTVAGGVIAVALLWGVVWLSELRTGSPPVNGVIRLAWRTSGQRITICRPYTAEELAILPMHMRRKEKCEDKQLHYQLSVASGGQPVFARRIMPAGVHGDRPLFVQEDMVLAPGSYDLHVRFEPAPDPHATEAGDTARLQIEESLRRSIKIDWRRNIEVSAGRVALVTWDAAQQDLTLVSSM